ncbi:MAG TPA: GntR family transcriptional regulator [Clostridia bacterium]|nr:GntR family transcriptional regulator [Clostridia bacterium]
MSVLERESPLPLYFQIKRDLKEKILSGKLKPREKIPSEEDLRKEYQVSRMTVRQAILDLVREGLLERQHGKGTFVRKPKVETSTAQLKSFWEDMLEKGYRPGSRLLSIKTVPPNERIKAALSLNEQESIVKIERVRLANGEPISLDIAHYPSRLCSGLLHEDLENQSVYDLLENKFGVPPLFAVETLNVVKAPRRIAELLEVQVGAPFVHFIRTTYTRNHIPIEFVESYYRGDRYSLTITLSRKDKKQEDTDNS